MCLTCVLRVVKECAQQDHQAYADISRPGANSIFDTPDVIFTVHMEIAECDAYHPAAKCCCACLMILDMGVVYLWAQRTTCTSAMQGVE